MVRVSLSRTGCMITSAIWQQNCALCLASELSFSSEGYLKKEKKKSHEIQIFKNSPKYLGDNRVREVYNCQSISVEKVTLQATSEILTGI